MFRSCVGRADIVSRIAFLLIVALIGHDGLMAAPAIAAPGHETIVKHHASSTGLDESAGDSRPDHPPACGVGQVAAPRTLHHAEDFVPSVASIVDFALGSADSRAEGGGGWQEPLWPPAVRRALIQIFRI